MTFIIVSRTPVSSAKHPPPAPSNTPCACQRRRTPTAHTTQSRQRSPPEPPTPPHVRPASGTRRSPPRTGTGPSLPGAPPHLQSHSQSHPPPPTLTRRSFPLQNPAAVPHQPPQSSDNALPRYQYSPEHYF